MAFDQNGSTWQNVYIQMNPKWGALEINEEQTAAINALMIILFVPLFTKGIYPFIESRFGKFQLLDRMWIGMVLAGVSFIIMAIYEEKINNMDESVFETSESGMRICNKQNPDKCMPGYWILFPYIVLTFAEVMFSISGLNLTYQEVGKSMKASSASLWLLTVSIGNILVYISLLI